MFEINAWNSVFGTVTHAEQQYHSQKIPFWKWVSVNYSFRFLPSCRDRLRQWHTEGAYTSNLNACTHTALDYFELVEALTRVLLWCGDWKNASRYAKEASDKYTLRQLIATQRGESFLVPRHFYDHLCIIHYLARARSTIKDNLQQIPQVDIVAHLEMWNGEGVLDGCQRARVFAGYARVAAKYDLLLRSLQFGWCAMLVREVPAFVRVKAVLSFLSLPFIWLRSV